MKAIISIILLLTGNLYIVFPRVTHLTQEENKPVEKIGINGKVQTAGEDTVNLILYPYYSEFRMQLDGIKYSSVTDEGSFNFDLPPIDKPYYLSLFLSANSNTRNTINLFLIEPGDSIHFFITKDTIKFSGKGSKKFICQYAMQQVPEISFTKDELRKFYPKMQGYAFNKFREQKKDSLKNVQMGILDKYRTKLSDLVYKRLRTDLFYKELFELYGSLQFGFHIKADIVTREEQIQFFKDLERRNIQVNVPESILLESKSYTDFLIMKSLTTILVDKYQQQDKELYRYSWSELFDYFQGKYSGLIHDKIMAISAFTFYKRYGSEKNHYLSQAIDEASDSYFRNILLNVQTLRTAGSPAYPFELKDATENIVKLEDFAGKVIVMDFWFTGCVNCVDMEKQMTIVRNKFKNNIDVVFLSVSLDKNKQTWLKSVQSGLYSGNGSITLYTSGNGADDPLVKHYEIKGCPELIIVDKAQKNFSTKPVRPENEKSTENFINLITQALNEG